MDVNHHYRALKLSPFYIGVVGWLLLITTLAACLVFLFPGFAPPSAELMRSLAQVGTALLLGFVIEATWMSARIEHEDDDREKWLGLTTGIGLSGLIGIAVALLVAEHRVAGHNNALDDLGLWWSISSMAILGVFITLQPLIVSRWTQED